MARSSHGNPASGEARSIGTARSPRAGFRPAAVLLLRGYPEPAKSPRPCSHKKATALVTISSSFCYLVSLSPPPRVHVAVSPFLSLKPLGGQSWLLSDFCLTQG